MIRSVFPTSSTWGLVVAGQRAADTERDQNFRSAQLISRSFIQARRLNPKVMSTRGFETARAAIGVTTQKVRLTHTR